QEQRNAGFGEEACEWTESPLKFAPPEFIARGAVRGHWQTSAGPRLQPIAGQRSVPSGRYAHWCDICLADATPAPSSGRFLVAEVSLSQARVDPEHGVSLREAFWVWMRVAALSFGGPAGQIAVMHRILVEEKRWVSESRFLHALNYCMLLPGPEAQQLATYIGWLMHRTLGGIMAGGLFVVPGIIAIMVLSYIYAGYGNVPFVVALFFGLKAAVLAIVVEAVVRIGKRALKNNAMVALAAAAFIGIFF